MGAFIRMLMCCAMLGQGFTATLLRIPPHVRYGEAKGYCDLIWEALQKELPTLVLMSSDQWVSKPRKELDLRVGLLDADCGMFRTEERETFLDFSTIPVMEMSVKIAVRADDSIEINNFPELQKASTHDMILVDFGSPFIGMLKAHGIDQFDDHGLHADQNLKKLAAGRGRFFIYREPGLSEKIRQAKLDHSLKVLPVTLETQPQYVVYSKHLSPAVKSMLNDALIQLKMKGIIDQIDRQWQSR